MIDFGFYWIVKKFPFFGSPYILTLITVFLRNACAGDQNSAIVNDLGLFSTSKYYTIYSNKTEFDGPNRCLLLQDLSSNVAVHLAFLFGGLDNRPNLSVNTN